MASVWTTFRVRSTARDRPIYLSALAASAMLLTALGIWQGWLERYVPAETATTTSTIAPEQPVQPASPDQEQTKGATDPRSRTFAPMMFLAALPAVLGAAAAAVRLDSSRPIHVLRAAPVHGRIVVAARVIASLLLIGLPIAALTATPEAQIDSSARTRREAAPGLTRWHRFPLQNATHLLPVIAQFAQRISIEVPQGTAREREMNFNVRLLAFEPSPDCRGSRSERETPGRETPEREIAGGNDPPKLETEIIPGCYAIMVDSLDLLPEANLATTFGSFVAGLASEHEGGKRPAWVDVKLNLDQSKPVMRPGLGDPDSPTVSPTGRFVTLIVPPAATIDKPGPKHVDIGKIELQGDIGLKTAYVWPRTAVEWREYDRLNVEVLNSTNSRVWCFKLNGAGVQQETGTSGPDPHTRAPWVAEAGDLPKGVYTVRLVNGGTPCKEDPSSDPAATPGSAKTEAVPKDIRLENARLTVELARAVSGPSDFGGVVDLGPVRDVTLARETVEIPAAFKFDLAGERRLTLEMPYHPTRDLEIFLYDAAYRLLDHADDPETLTRLLPIGTYYVMVQPYRHDWQSAGLKLPSPTRLTITTVK